MKRLVFASFVAGALLLVVAATAAVTHDNNGKSGKASLDSFQEVPTLATTGRGSFRIRVRSDGLHYRLSYSGVESNVTQAHIHLGRTAVNGGIIAFLCGPQPQAGDKPVCPLREGTVEGVIDAADIGAGAAGQGIPAGDLTDAVRSLRRARSTRTCTPPPSPAARSAARSTRTATGTVRATGTSASLRTSNFTRGPAYAGPLRLSNRLLLAPGPLDQPAL